MKRLMAAILIICFCLSSCGYMKSGEEDVAFFEGKDDRLSFEVLGEREVNETPFRRFVWISYLDLRSIISADREKTNENAEKMCQNILKIKTTDVFLQVRAFGDAIYNSDYFISAYNTVYSDYSSEIDYFEILLELLHSYGIKVHAWVNPYRLSDSQSEENSQFIKSLTEKDVLSVIEYNDGISLNPANDTAKELIISGIDEILNGYDVDGIHFDDYFYPTTDAEYDENTYERFIENGGMMSLDDFRRDNFSRLVAAVYERVKQKDASIEFGISPDASLSRDFSMHYANVELWCNAEGYIDYICPQIYFGFENESMPFSSTLGEWARVCGSCDLFVGLSFYKAGSEDIFAGSGSDEWTKSFDIISRQYIESGENGVCKGVALYRYNSLFNPSEETASYAAVEMYNLQKVI